ncbi:hypothetical protein [Gluconobacter kanchanaburiensis]|uniref:hypothetical protein n=1 Tax=Gluconobacter kanchanaburiensis TaxID=563199 RepID=UPI0011BEEEE6|nr:hypothetical protein [Gluconobacter kanchanaburiensis]MBF0862708.1 hypothetical protein [Gluconobacter kanchanaburiensis]
MRRLDRAYARQILRGGAGRDQVITELEANHRQRPDLRRTGIVRLTEGRSDHAPDRGDFRTRY